MENVIEIKVPKDDVAFLKIRETLSRIGIPTQKDGELPTLWQSCHILQKQGRYYIVHFKEMFLIDKKESKTVITNEDIARRDAIAFLLNEWGLVELLEPIDKGDTKVFVVAFKDKENWQLKPKYTMRKIKKDEE